MTMDTSRHEHVHWWHPALNQWRITSNWNKREWTLQQQHYISFSLSLFPFVCWASWFIVYTIVGLTYPIDSSCIYIYIRQICSPLFIVQLQIYVQFNLKKYRKLLSTRLLEIHWGLYREIFDGERTGEWRCSIR